MDSRRSTSDMSARCRPLLCHVTRDSHVTRIASKVVISKSGDERKKAPDADPTLGMPLQFNLLKV